MKSRHPILASDDDGDYIVGIIRQLPNLFEEFFETLADALEVEHELRIKGIVVSMEFRQNESSSSTDGADAGGGPSGEAADNPLSTLSLESKEMLLKPNFNNSRKTGADGNFRLSISDTSNLKENQDWGSVLVSGSGLSSRVRNPNTVASRAFLRENERGTRSSGNSGGNNNKNNNTAANNAPSSRISTVLVDSGIGRLAVPTSATIETEEDIVHLIMLRMRSAKLFAYIRRITSELEQIPASSFRIVSAGRHLEVNTVLTHILSKVVLLWNGEAGLSLNEQALGWSKPLVKLGQDAVSQLDCTIIVFSAKRRLRRDMTSPTSPIYFIIRLCTVLSVLVTVAAAITFAIVPPQSVIAITLMLVFGAVSVIMCSVLVFAYTSAVSALAAMLETVADVDISGHIAAHTGPHQKSTSSLFDASGGGDVFGSSLPLYEQIQRHRKESRYNDGIDDSAQSSLTTNLAGQEESHQRVGMQTTTRVVHVNNQRKGGEGPMDASANVPVSLTTAPTLEGVFGSINYETSPAASPTRALQPRDKSSNILVGAPPVVVPVSSSAYGGSERGGLHHYPAGSSGVMNSYSDNSLLAAPLNSESGMYFPLFYSSPGIGGLPPGVSTAFVDCRFIDAQLVMIGFDESFNVVLWNAAAEAATGFLETEVLGKPIIELLEAPFPDFNTLVADEQVTSAVKILLKAFATSSIPMFAICAPVVVSRQSYQQAFSQSQYTSNNSAPSSSRASMHMHPSQYRANQQRSISGTGFSGSRFANDADPIFSNHSSSAFNGNVRRGSTPIECVTVGHVLICSAGKDNLQDANFYMTNYFASQLAVNLRRVVEDGSIQYKQDRQIISAIRDFAARGASRFLRESAKTLADEWEWVSGQQLLSRALRHHLNKCEVIPLGENFPTTLFIHCESVSRCLERIVELSPSNCTVMLDIVVDTIRNVASLTATITIVDNKADSRNRSRNSSLTTDPAATPFLMRSSPKLIPSLAAGDAGSLAGGSVNQAPQGILKKPSSTLSSSPTPLSTLPDQLKEEDSFPDSNDENAASTSTKKVLITTTEATPTDSTLLPDTQTLSSKPSTVLVSALAAVPRSTDSSHEDVTFDLDSMLVPGTGLPKALNRCFGIVTSKRDETVLELTVPCQLTSYNIAVGAVGAFEEAELMDNDSSMDAAPLGVGGALNSSLTAVGGGGFGDYLSVSQSYLQQSGIGGPGRPAITCTVNVMTMISNLVDQHNLSLVLLKTAFIALTNIRHANDLESKIRSNNVDVVVADKHLYWQTKTLLQDRLDVFLVPLMSANAPHDPLIPYILRTPIDHKAVVALMTDIGEQVEGRKRAQKEREERERILASRQDSPWTQGKLLGRGACGVVYEAIIDLTGGKMAVKMFYFKKTSDADKEMALMLQEIKIMCSLVHPNIVRYFYCERKDQNLNLFMELCDGSLADYISKKKQAPNNAHQGNSQNMMSTNEIIEQTLRALVYLHDMGITHRDIKPQNILIKGRLIKMTDFGTARQNMEEDLLDVQGTFRYMAPEVYRGQPHSQSCDIWSLGCLTAELLGSPLVFMEPKNHPMLGDMTGVTVPTSLRGEVRDFVEQCLNMDPYARPRASMLLLHPFLTSDSEVQTLLSFADAQARPGGKRDSVASHASAFSLSSAASKVSKATTSKARF